MKQSKQSQQVSLMQNIIKVPEYSWRGKIAKFISKEKKQESKPSKEYEAQKRE